MISQLNIHPDFQKIRGMELRFKPWIFALLNGAVHLAAAMKWSKYKDIVTHHTVIGLDGHRVPVWIIRPENLKVPSPTLIYSHGGWWVMKHAPQHIENAVRYARKANCCVVFVDYRLAYRHPFPAAFNDCYSALIWANQNAEKLGFDKERIAVGGDSAGGAIAAGAAQKARDEGILLCGQLLIYPVTDSDCKSESSKLFVDVAPFKRENPNSRWEMYLGHPAADGVPNYASPIHGKLANLAQAYVETNEFDVLRDEAAAYAKALIDNNVSVCLNETKGTVHGYDLLEPESKISQDAMISRIKFLRTIFEN